MSIADVIAVLSYIGTFNGDAASPMNTNGVRYDSLKAGDWFNSTRRQTRPATRPHAAHLAWAAAALRLPNGAATIQNALVALNQVG